MDPKDQELSDINVFRNSISYLYSISKLNVSIPTLQCVYLTKSRLMELRKNIRLPNNLTKSTIRCQRCLLDLNDGPANYQINPEAKKSKFARKVLSKSAQNQALTKFQLRYLKKLDKFNGNQLAITCKFCTKETVVKLEKPKKIVTLNNQQKKVSKKKKKKDKFCGLNQEVISLVTPQKVKKQAVSSPVALKDKNKNVSVEQYRHVTSQDVRNFDTSDFMPLQTKGKKFSKLQLSKGKDKDPKKTAVGVAKKNQQKPKKSSKLKDFLNNSTPRSSPSVGLKNFLKTL